jgi:hypothetical protein
LLGHPYIKYKLCDPSHFYFFRYFPVTEDESISTTCSSHQQSAFNKVVLAFKRKEQQSLDFIHKAIGDNKLSVQTPWLAATKWLERFAEANMNMLAELAERTKKRADCLEMVEKEIRDLIEEGQAGLWDVRT